MMIARGGAVNVPRSRSSARSPTAGTILPENADRWRWAQWL
jgi:hypothetical protein